MFRMKSFRFVCPAHGLKTGTGLLLAAIACAFFQGAFAGEPELAACLGEPGPAGQVIPRCTTALQASDITAPKRSALYTKRGLAYMADGDLRRARDDLDQAVALDATSTWALNARAVLFMQLGLTDQAIGDYEAAIKIKPGYAFAWSNLASARLVQGDTDRALANFSEAIRLAPERLEIALTGRGKVWLARGEYDRAAEDFSAALKLNPRYANALSGRAAAHFCKAEFAAAADDIRGERSIRRDPQSSVELLIAVRRAGKDGRAELAQIAQADGDKKGDVPGIALFRGTISPEQALQSTNDKDPLAQRQRQCTTNFAVGQWYLLQTDIERARVWLGAAREGCDQSRAEYAEASADLNRLNESAPDHKATH